jgi:hypothetical protein
VATPAAASKRGLVEITGKFAPGNPWAPAAPATSKSESPPPAASTASAPDAEPATKRTQKKNRILWAIERTLMPGPSKAWPAAFAENDRHEQPPLKPVALEAASEAATPAAVAGPVIPADLHQKVARECGGLAKAVKVVVRPDQGIVVQVLPVNWDAERTLIDRLLRLPEMNAPNVHLAIELTP